MGLQVWNIIKEPFENHKGWDLFSESTKTYGMTTMETFRIRARKDEQEIVFEQDYKNRSQHKLKMKMQEYIDTLEDYKLSLKEYRNEY